MNNRKVIINKICKLNRETIGSINQPDFINYLDTGNITRNKIDEIKKLYKGLDKYPSRAQRKVKFDTIIYSTVRPEQEHFGIIENSIENLIVSTGFTTLDIIDDSVDAKYLYYALTNRSITEYLNVIATNNVTSYPSLNPSDIGDLVFKIPNNKLEQQKIAKVLSDLDNKIELNNKINTELEAMAKTLYDYWFVQFDFPDVNGKPYKTSGGKMVWNEELKREIPEGWEVKRLDKVMKIVRGASPRPIDDFMSPVGIPWIKISDATKSNNRFILFTKEFIKKEGASKSRELQPGTLILSNSASPAIPKIVNMNACVHDGWLIIDSFKLGFYNEFMFHYFENFREKILNMGTGSIFKNLKTEYIKELLIAVPHNYLLNESKKIFKNLSDQILMNAKQNQELASLRDWLLPMLMNGQVSVGEVAKEYQMEDEVLGMVAESVVEYKKI